MHARRDIAMLVVVAALGSPAGAQVVDTVGVGTSAAEGAVGGVVSPDKKTDPAAGALNGATQGAATGAVKGAVTGAR